MKKADYVKAVIILVLAFSFPVMALDDFTIPINVNNQSLVLGMDSEALNDYDSKDVAMPPAMPGEIDALLYCGSCAFQRLQADVRKDSGWVLNVNSPYNFLIGWNASSIPNNVNVFLSDINMAGQNSAAFSAGNYSFGIKLKPYLPGDVSADCSVNMADLSFIGAALFREAYSSFVDLNDDGTINVLDLATAGINYGKTC
jgi:hypothetical protein